MENKQESFRYALNIFLKKIKYIFLPLFFFVFLLLPLNVAANFYDSQEEVANKMNNYIRDAIVNGEWIVKDDEDNASLREIIVYLDTSDPDFDEVMKYVSSDANAHVYYCSDDSCSDWDQYSEDGIIDFYLVKNSDDNPYIRARAVGPDTYKKVVNSPFHYVINTKEAGRLPFVAKYHSLEGNAKRSSSNSVEMEKAVGTYANPALVGVDTTITIPNKDADIWNGQTDACYYFKVDFSAANSKDTTGRYKIDPVRDGYEFRWYQGGVFRDFAYQDKGDTSLFGFANKNVYAICSVYDDNDYYGKTIHFTYQDSEAVSINEYYLDDPNLAKEQLGDDYVIIPNELVPLPEGWGEEIVCDDIFDWDDEGSVGWILKTILDYIKIIGPIAVVLLSALDFIKAILSSDEKVMKEAQSKLVIRLIAAVALFLIPTLVELLFNFINTTSCLPE